MYNLTDYHQLLQRPEWKAKRLEILDRDNHVCKNCGSTENLQVHHKQYHFFKNGRIRNPWEYEGVYLITLCHRCHEAGHKKYIIPHRTL